MDLVFSCFSGTKLKANHQEAKVLVYSMAKTPYNPEDAVHNFMLISIYQHFKKEQCNIIGAHWKLIGF